MSIISIISIKDIDYIIIFFLDNQSLYSLKKVNNYYNKILDNSFWKRRYYNYYKRIVINKYIKDKYINPCNEKWWKYSMKIDKLMRYDNPILSLYESILLDDYNIFNIIIHLKKMNPDQLFNISKYKDPHAYNYVDNKELRFTCLDLIVEKDSINCFKKFFSPETNFYHKKLLFHCFYYSLKYKSVNIIKRMLNKKWIIINVKILQMLILHNFEIPELYELNKGID